MFRVDQPPSKHICKEFPGNLIVTVQHGSCLVCPAQFDWRNGWFYAHTKAALDTGDEDPYPKHTAWLKEVGAI